MGYYKPRIAAINEWLNSSRETTNFTYDLTDSNKDYLASFVSSSTGISYEAARGYIQELDNDLELRDYVQNLTVSGPKSELSDPVQHYGRRLGWYALARAIKPKMIVETGVEKGLGSCVLARALMTNANEGHNGRYIGTDIDPSAGYLFKPPYSDHGEIMYGDSISSLMSIEEPIDLFINDSDHSAEYEAREYISVAEKLSPNALILGDNAHVTDCLHKFAVETDRQFLYFQEVPKDHWYPGGGIGVAFRKD